MSETNAALANDECDCSTCNPSSDLRQAFHAASECLPDTLDAGELSLFIHGTMMSYGLNDHARGELLLNTLLVGNIEEQGATKGHEATVELIGKFVAKLAVRLIEAASLQVDGMSAEDALEKAAARA
jgi:hypothetical protein